MATGVDRVELAYLARFLDDDTPCFGFVRTAFGYLLLDRAGLEAVQVRLEGRHSWGRADFLSRYLRGRTDVGKRAEADFRRLAIARAAPWRLSSMLENIPKPCRYFNVGHSNLTTRVLSSLKRAGVEINALVHDVIPLEYPQFQRPGTVAPFRDKLKCVQNWANLVIYNSADTQHRAEAQMAAWGQVPKSIVAHLGTVRPIPDLSALPDGLPPEQPYFVIVGTIEPRKNHAFLLDIWEKLGPDAPLLLICGSRGWNNEAVFERLDRMTADGPIREIPNLSDAALAALVQHASGALFPSLAEGFGLPPLEALLLETRVLCNDLGVLREFLGYMPVYASVFDEYQWLKVIQAWAETPEMENNPKGFEGPTWDDHFNKVLSLRV
jgi:glycosyltransferase involved in cell wall biosynthesis